jgi:hypothetical protein
MLWLNMASLFGGAAEVGFLSVSSPLEVPGFFMFGG